MIYFVTGDNREKVQKTSHGIIAVLQKKRPEALLFRVNTDEWNPDTFAGIATGQGLFESKYIVVLDSLFQNEESAEYLEARMKELKDADHAFVFVEYSPKAPAKKLISKHAEKVWDTSDAEKTGGGGYGAKGAGTAGSKKEFNIFAMTDALGERNRARLWSLYQKALLNGSEPEEIHGLLFWQVKSLLAAAQSTSAADAGMKPFVWSKSQGFLRNYSVPELRKISSDMMGLYHLSRIDGAPLEIALEEFVLAMGKSAAK